MADDPEVRAFKRKWFRTVTVMYWLMLGLYVVCFAMFIHLGNYAQAVTMVTLSVFVSLSYWFSRAMMRINGDL